ncbi:hypothetical protein AJ80_08225 [Polytolypa hystricis UAMH7299]|uniref:MARVEL domain-containing protein n=1 Tax=Polytolypa hystricis (strain UAMH7299) TaxID=1447883 RepID=A0A2B7XB50_POLH7|nr:hypothetical protein AJ80_08225 [Polytolypa hystricis UAMH7299]
MGALNMGLRGLLFFFRFIVWGSAAIVLGINSYFIHNFSTNQHQKYIEIISAISLAFFLPGLLSPFIPRIGALAFIIDITFSYLWLAGFIFLAQDYNWRDCHANTPPGGRCSLKYAMEAFTFITFFFALMAALLEIYNLWTYHQRRSTTTTHNKELPRTSAETGGTGTTAGVV